MAFVSELFLSSYISIDLGQIWLYTNTKSPLIMSTVQFPYLLKGKVKYIKLSFAVCFYLTLTDRQMLISTALNRL